MGKTVGNELGSAQPQKDSFIISTAIFRRVSLSSYSYVLVISSHCVII